MPTTIKGPPGRPINSIDDISNLQQADAKRTLLAISTQLRGADGKSSKSGVLSLVSAHDGKGLSFERKSFYQVWARRSSRMDETAKALSALGKQAKLNPDAQRALKDYLLVHQNKVGGRKFAELLEQLVTKNADELIPTNNGGAKSKPTQTAPRRSVADSSEKEKRFDDASLPAGFKGRNLVYGRTASKQPMYEYELGTGKGMEKVRAHLVPGIDGARYYLEVQEGDNCTVHSANAALALMTGGLKYLITKGEMRDYAAKQGSSHIKGSFPLELYVKMNNACTDGRPELTELKANIRTSGDGPKMIFTSLDDAGVGQYRPGDDDDPIAELQRYKAAKAAERAMYAQRRAQVDAAATVGMTYGKLVNGDLRGQHTIVVHCEKQPDANGPGVYVVLDSMESKPSTVSGACASMSEAIKQVFEQRTGGAGVQVDLFMRAS